MSYRCQFCGEAQANGARPRKVVTKIRKRRYHAHGGEAFGWEIDTELDMCEPCEGRTDIVELEAGVAVRGELYIEKSTLTATLGESLQHGLGPIEAPLQARVDGGLV